MNVFLAISCTEDGDDYGIFSTEEKAADWLATKPFAGVVSPYVVDEPDFGNVKGH